MTVGLALIVWISSLYPLLINDVKVSVGTFHKNPYVRPTGTFNVSTKADSLCLWVKFGFIFPQTRFSAEIEDTHGCLFSGSSSELGQYDNHPFIFANFPAANQTKTLRLRLDKDPREIFTEGDRITVIVNRPVSTIDFPPIPLINTNRGDLHYLFPIEKIDGFKIEHKQNFSFIRSTNDLSLLKPAPAGFEVYYWHPPFQFLRLVGANGDLPLARFSDIYGNSSFDGRNLCHYFPMKVELMDAPRKRTLDLFRIPGTQRLLRTPGHR